MLMKRVRTLLTITIVSMLASIAIGAPIHTAAEKGNLARVRTLLNNGVAVDAKDGQGRTPLYMAASWCRKQVIQLLIDKGAEIPGITDGFDGSAPDIGAFESTP